ncbi:MAG: hypothetical protein IJV14_08655 [Lachnospiraceae bacterium]|nr:hypothetical protein [Lachnospiraceae bacterium]
MNENIRMFIEKLSNDQEAAAKMSAIRDPEEAYQLASSIQDGFTKEEFISAMEELRESVQHSEELLDEDLVKVAGGDDREIASTISVSVVSVASIVGMASAAI